MKDHMVWIFAYSLGIGSVIAISFNIAAGFDVFDGHIAHAASFGVISAVSIIPITLGDITFHIAFAVMSPYIVAGMRTWTCGGDGGII